MASIKLSDAKIKTLKPQEKTYRILDADRLYIEVRPSGAKIWRFKFVLNGKESSMSLGEYPSITLAEARTLKEEMRAKLAKGINPVEERRQAKEAQKESNKNTFDAIAAEYFNERLTGKSFRYKEKFGISMQVDILPVIGNKNIRDVTAADVLKILRNTVARVKKESDGRYSGESAAIQNRTFIGSVSRYAIATLRCENDPTYAVRDAIQRPPVNHARPLTKQERKMVRVNLESYNGTQTVKNAGFILIYTMLRAVEIRRMEWSWIDFDEQTITFPREVMKKNRAHILPISKQVSAILKSQFEISGNHDIVFPSVYRSKKDNGMIAKETLNDMLRYIGLKGVTTHDFRATASTLLYEKGYEEDWIEKQLAHAESNKTKASYDHSKHLQQRREMIQDWANIVDSWKDLK